MPLSAVSVVLYNSLGNPEPYTTTATWVQGASAVSVTFDTSSPTIYSYAISDDVLSHLPTSPPSLSTSKSATSSGSQPPISSPGSTATSTTSTSASATSGITSTSSPTSSASTTATSSTSSTSGISAPPKQTKSVNHEAGVSNGAAAGIGIGCAVIGALLAALGVWILMRKERHPRRSYSAPVERSLSYGGEGLGKGSSGSPPIPLQSLPGSTVDRMLPQPLDDNTIGRDFSKLGTALKNHAQTYYVSEKDSSARADTTAIQRLLGPESSLDSGTVADMLARAHSRLSATRYLLACAVIQRIDDDLLPPGVATCMQSMTGLAHDPNGRAACLGRWRAISALLMQDTYGKAQLSPSDSRVRRANELAETLDNVLRPFASSRYSHDERINNLQGVIQRAIRYGYLLFSQPSTWDFDWTLPKEKSGDHVVVFPALLQVTDEQGNILARPRRMTEKEFANRMFMRG